MTFGKDLKIDFIKLSSSTKDYIKSFQCGNAQIDDYFQNKAYDDNSTVTYLFLDNDSKVVIACVSICCSRIDFFDIKKRVNSSMPAFEIKYFATNKAYHKLPYSEGSSLTLSKVIMNKVIDYLYNDCRSVVGAVRIILYSVKQAVHFYEGCYFEKFDPYMYRTSDEFVSECVPMFFDLDPIF